MILRKIHGVLVLLSVLVLAGRAWAESPHNYCKDNYESFKDRIAKDPGDTVTWKELRVCTDELHRWNTISDVVNAALAKNDKLPDAHLMLGLVHFHLKEYPDAIAELDKTIALRHDDPIPYYYTGMSYLFMRQPAESVKAAERAAELEPKNPSNFSQLAYAYFLLDDRPKCEASAKKALELNPNEVSAYKVLGNLYAKEGRTEDSDHMFEEAIHANGRIAAGGAAPTVTAASSDGTSTKPTMYTLPGVPTPVVVAAPATPSAAAVPTAVPSAPAQAPAVAPAVTAASAISAEAPDAATACKTQWEEMKLAIQKGDTQTALMYYSDYAETREQYRQSFQKLGPERLKTMFANLGELYDCEVEVANATCKATVQGPAGQLLVATVRFEHNEDHAWRIRSF